MLLVACSIIITNIGGLCRVRTLRDRLLSISDGGDVTWKEMKEVGSLKVTVRWSMSVEEQANSGKGVHQRK